MRNSYGIKVLGCVAAALFFTLSLAGSGWSANFPGEIIYQGRNVVDFNFGRACTNEKCVLIRNGQTIKEWTKEDKHIYYSDTTANAYAPNFYAFKRYYWDYENGKWESQPRDVFNTMVDTTTVRGSLHNSWEWCNKLGRSPVSWSAGNNPYSVESLVVEDGALYINSGVNVTFSGEGGEISVRRDAGIEAEGASFTKQKDAAGSVTLSGQSQEGSRFQRCTITDVIIYAEGSSAGIRFVNNIITMTPDFKRANIITLHNSSNNIFQNNKGNASVDLSGANNTIKNNVLASLGMTGTGLIEGNTCDQVIIAPSNNGIATVRGNALKSLRALGGAPVIENNSVKSVVGSNDYRGIECNSCNGAKIKNNSVENFSRYGIEIIGGNANTIEGNLIQKKQQVSASDSAGIYLWGTENNLVKKNNILGMYGRGIHLYMAKHNNIEYNAVNNSTLEGILFENCYNWCELNEPDGSSDNVIAFNHLWKNNFGIRAHENKGCHKRNGIHENIIAENDIGVSIGKTNTDNVIFNNVFKNNTINAYDGGERNIWCKDPPIHINRNIVGGALLGGNFWSDYAGTDADNNGLGDTPYDIPGGEGGAVKQDLWPLIDKGYKPPVIQAEPTPFVFSLPFGESVATKTLSVSNRGGENLVMGKASISGGDAAFFTLTNDACNEQTLAPQGKCLIDVTFTTAQDDSIERKAAILLPSNDPVTPVLWVGINGTIIQPLPGDVNGDGIVNLSDAVLALQVLAGRTPPDGQTIVKAADVNSDGQIGLAEVFYVLQKVVALR
ncbi:MAG: NosD domain-containing protein [Pseudomonadota bacterium]|nr:NosD domain-containing protein [Pseudomonadota bacterium]